MSHAAATLKRINQLKTKAWLLRGISSIPGELNLRGGMLSFVAFNTASAWPWQLRKLERAVAAAGTAQNAEGIAEPIDDGQRTVVFNWPVAELRARCPWYYFGGGLQIARASLVLKFSFGRPANLSPRLPIQDLFANLNELSAMRSQGKLWQAVLTKEAAKRADA